MGFMAPLHWCLTSRQDEDRCRFHHKIKLSIQTYIHTCMSICMRIYTYIQVHNHSMIRLRVFSCSSQRAKSLVGSVFSGLGSFSRGTSSNFLDPQKSPGEKCQNHLFVRWWATCKDSLALDIGTPSAAICEICQILYIYIPYITCYISYHVSYVILNIISYIIKEIKI